MKEYWREVNNQQAEETWFAKSDQLFRAIEICLTEGLWEASLILLYSGIDAMAWLDRPADAPDGNAKHFESWCDRYLLDPVDDLLTSQDLYAARCGLLHSHTADLARDLGTDNPRLSGPFLKPRTAVRLEVHSLPPSSLAQQALRSASCRVVEFSEWST